jgi:hypothetical protein
MSTTVEAETAVRPFHVEVAPELVRVADAHADTGARLRGHRGRSAWDGLTMPVLAIGGEESGGEGVAATMKLVADDVKGAVLTGSGH